MYALQSRWKLEGRRLVYYGMRNRENLLQNEIRLSRKQAAVIASLPKALSGRELRVLKKLLGLQVVQASEVRPIPTSLKEAVFCARCSANDFMIPGLEFDANGLCPMCQTEEETRTLRSIVPLVREIPRAKHSRFDAALFYTGGKDSTFLLYYLSQVMGLRILALTWEIPYMSESARKSIENAKQRFPRVEFILHRTAARPANHLSQAL